MPNDAGTLNRKEAARSMKDYCASRDRAMKEVWGGRPMRESHDDMGMSMKKSKTIMKKGKKK